MLKVTANEVSVDGSEHMELNSDTLATINFKNKTTRKSLLDYNADSDDDFDDYDDRNGVSNDKDQNNDYMNDRGIKYSHFNRRYRKNNDPKDSSNTNDKTALLKNYSKKRPAHTVGGNSSSSSESGGVNPFSISDGDYNSDDEKSELFDRSSDAGCNKRKLGCIEILTLNLTYMALNMLFLLLCIEIVPAQIEAIVGSGHKGIVLGCTVALGAVITFIMGPLIGMKSDRLTGRFGRRRPIITVGIAFLCLFTLILVSIAPPINSKNMSTPNTTQCPFVNLTERRCRHINQNNPIKLNTVKFNVTDTSVKNRIFIYVPCYLLMISAYITTITPYNALIADKSHPEQRGLCSGAMGGMILLGNILGACLGLLITPLGAVTTVFIGLSVASICVVITMYSTDEVPYLKTLDNLSCKEKLTKFYTPLKDHDFRWLFLTRFLMQQGLTSTIGFLEYYVNDMIQLPPCWNVYRAVSYLLLPLLMCAAISSIINGIISDKTGKRKSILFITSIIMAISCICMTFLKGPNAFYIAILLTSIFGIALGGYQAIDFALLMDIIPEGKDQSLRIAVWHQAMVLPQALAVPVSGLIVDVFERFDCAMGLGYLILMVVIAAYFLTGGLLINKIRGSN